MYRFVTRAGFWVLLCSAVSMTSWAQSPPTGGPPPASQPAQPLPKVPEIPFESVPDYLKYPDSVVLGETLAVAVNSKGHLVVLNHPGSTGGPLYGAATTQLLEFDAKGKFLREIGKGVYGLGYGHSVRFDKYDNLWVVDKGTSSVMKFNPAGRVVMNLGRREEAPDEHRYINLFRGDPPPTQYPGYFNEPTDVAWDDQDNIYISDGYKNSRVAKFDKDGVWIKSWGTFGSGAEQFMNPHNIGVDRNNNVYVAARNNKQIKVFDRNGTYLRSILLLADYDKTRPMVMGPNPAPFLQVGAQGETAPWTVCITNGPTQYLYTSDAEPGRIYKFTLDGKLVGVLGKSGRAFPNFGWIHGIACPDENTLYIADMINWRVQKLILHPEKMGPR